MTLWRVESGTPAGYDLELEHIEGGLYGLFYTGFWRCKAWCYVASSPDAAVFCQPLKPKNGAVGTSITNIWDLGFILTVSALAPIGERALYEYYLDDREQGISRVTYRKSQQDSISWKFTPASFADIVGYPEPAFASLAWGRDAAKRCEAHNLAAGV